MFSSLFSVLSAFLLALSYLVNAAPVQYLAYAPTITSPTNGTVWYTGSKENITWLTNNVPSEARNYTLTFLLGYLNNGSENLDIGHPLASQVPIMQGTVSITVPLNLTTRKDYVVAAIGDSGDVSPPFTIIPY